MSQTDSLRTGAWIGLRVKQVRCTDEQFKHYVGRESKVVDAFIDEKGNIHCRTEDRIWCPSDLLEALE